MCIPGSADRLWHHAGVSSTDARNLVRLVVISGYALTLLALDDLHLGQGADVALTIACGVLWLVLAVDLGVGIWRGPTRAAVIRAHLGYLPLLVAPVFVGPDLQWGVLLLVLIGYVLEVRRVARGRAVAFSFGLVVFVAVIATWTMVLVERADPRSELGSVGEASAWAVSTLLRVPGFRSSQPVTQDGRLLTLVVGVCAVLAATFLTAQLVTWVVGVRGDDAADRSATDEQVAALASELASLRACVMDLTARLGDAPSMSATHTPQSPMVPDAPPPPPNGPPGP